MFKSHLLLSLSFSFRFQKLKFFYPQLQLEWSSKIFSLFHFKRSLFRESGNSFEAAAAWTNLFWQENKLHLTVNFSEDFSRFSKPKVKPVTGFEFALKKWSMIFLELHWWCSRILVTQQQDVARLHDQTQLDWFECFLTLVALETKAWWSVLWETRNYLGDASSSWFLSLGRLSSGYGLVQTHHPPELSPANLHLFLVVPRVIVVLTSQYSSQILTYSYISDSSYYSPSVYLLALSLSLTTMATPILLYSTNLSPLETNCD